MDEPKAERRIPPRKRVLKGGRIVFNNRHSVIDCTVRNVSVGGALLLVKSVIGVPDQFDLELDGEMRPVSVMWRREGQIGVKFG